MIFIEPEGWTRMESQLAAFSRETSRAFDGPLARSRQSSVLASDVIDRLAHIAGPPHIFHHEGPFDAAHPSRRQSLYPPIDALIESNAQALAATPIDSIMRVLNQHHPIDGTASIRPGMLGMPSYAIGVDADPLHGIIAVSEILKSLTTDMSVAY
jgi:hypothetical protein